MGKRYNCPYCQERGERQDLVNHIDEEHSEELPEGFSSNRVVFNLVNNKKLGGSGICIVCKRETPWNDTSNKYDRLCGRQQCLDKLREAANKNMIRVHGKTTLLNDEDHQMKMLSNRGISGKYKFTDGGYHVYTGSYEKKALEFLDLVMGFKSTDLLCPGPVLEYEFNGETKKWITDIYLIPFNLIIEVKDGGANPNNRQMDSYRAKQVAKEELVTSLGKFNYLRLTDNDFSQLLYTISILKAQMVDDSEDNKKVVININEEVEALKENDLSVFLKMKMGIQPKEYKLRKESFIEARELIHSSSVKYGFKKYLRVFESLRVENSLARYLYGDNKSCILFAIELGSINKLEDRKDICTKVTKFLKEGNIKFTKNKFKNFEIRLHLDMDDYKYGEFAVYDHNEKEESSRGKVTAAMMSATVALLLTPFTTIYAAPIVAVAMYHDLTSGSLKKESFSELLGENMALGGTNPIVSPSSGVFLTQYGPKKASIKDEVEGYAIHNDIITDKIVTVDKSGKLAVKESSFLEGRNLRMFKYLGENTKGYHKILKSVDRRVYREYLYETLTDKRLLSDDQIICDECFQEISPTKIFAEYSSVAQTIVDQYKDIMGKGVIRLPLMNTSDINEASTLIKGNSNIKVFENLNGYFAENALTRERTGYYKNIKDIQIEVIL